jgi:hypothetical protein
MAMKVAFHKYYVTNGEVKAKVRYSPNISAFNGKNIISIYAKDYERNLSKILPNVRNDSDIMTDYFETDSCTIYEDTPEYTELLPKLREWGFAR